MKKTFSNINPKKVHQMLMQSTQKIKRKQTVNDFTRVHNFIYKNVKDNKLGGIINKTARIDNRFDSFFNDLSEKNKIPETIDVSKNPQSNNEKMSKNENNNDQIKNLIQDIKNSNQSDNHLDFEEKAIKYLDYTDLDFGNEGEFKMMLLDQRVTSNTTSLRRITTFKVLVWAGNMNGVVGYGRGTGLNFKRATERSIGNLKKNLIAINLDLLNTVPQHIYAKFGKYQIVLWHRKYNNAWGNPLFSSMLQLAGLRHCMFKFLYDTPNPFSLVYCLMKLLTQNTTPKLLAEELGKKVFDTSWGRRRYRDYDMDSLSV